MSRMQGGRRATTIAHCHSTTAPGSDPVLLKRGAPPRLHPHAPTCQRCACPFPPQLRPSTNGFHTAQITTVDPATRPPDTSRSKQSHAALLRGSCHTRSQQSAAVPSIGTHVRASTPQDSKSLGCPRGLVHVVILRPGTALPLPKCTPSCHYQVLFAHAHTNKHTPAHTAHTVHRPCLQSSDSLCDPTQPTVKDTPPTSHITPRPRGTGTRPAAQLERCTKADCPPVQGHAKPRFVHPSKKTAGHAVWSVEDKSDALTTARRSADAAPKPTTGSPWGGNSLLSAPVLLCNPMPSHPVQCISRFLGAHCAVCSAAHCLCSMAPASRTLCGGVCLTVPEADVTHGSVPCGHTHKCTQHAARHAAGA